jgi:hypothetical protein
MELDRRARAFLNLLAGVEKGGIERHWARRDDDLDRLTPLRHARHDIGQRARRAVRLTVFGQFQQPFAET